MNRTCFAFCFGISRMLNADANVYVESSRIEKSVHLFHSVELPIRNNLIITFVPATDWAHKKCTESHINQDIKRIIWMHRTMWRRWGGGRGCDGSEKKRGRKGRGRDRKEARLGLEREKGRDKRFRTGSGITTSNRNESGNGWGIEKRMDWKEWNEEIGLKRVS